MRLVVKKKVSRLSFVECFLSLSIVTVQSGPVCKFLGISCVTLAGRVDHVTSYKCISLEQTDGLTVPKIVQHV